MMRIDEHVALAMGLFDQEVAAIQIDLQGAIRRAVDERTRDAGENAQKHPVQSSTPLKDASWRAHSAVARAEKKYGPIIASALAGVVTIAFAREYADHIDRAIEVDERAKRQKGESGLYAAARKAVDRMYEFGAGKWHWAQIADPELKKFSDLLRWKAENPGHDDPNSPWPEINAIYEQRQMRSDLGNKLQLSLPRDPKPSFQPREPVSQIPTVDDMRSVAGDWAFYGMTPSARRTEGVGQLDTDDPYGGFLQSRAQDGAMAMQDREDNYAEATAPLGAEHWHRFEVPRSTYAVVEVGSRFDFPDLPQVYPPVAELRLLGVVLNYSRDKERELQEAEAGEGPSDILIETVRASFLQHNKCHDEDLIRFWLFLLIGRKYPDRVDALFPPGYFHGVRGPDVWESRHGSTHFQIVRVAADRDYRHMMRHPGFGPWGDL